MHTKKILLSFIFVIALVQYSYCQILTYTNATNGALNSVAANATGTALSRVNGITAPGSPCGTGYSCTNFSSSTTWSNTLGAVEVNATAAAGYQLNVTGFSADMRRSGTGPASVRFAYSTNGGTTWIDQGSNASPNNAACAATTTSTWTTSVSVGSANTLKFRLYGFNASSTAGTFQLLNLTISGTVSVVCIAPTLSTTVTNVSCNGGSNGSVNLSLTGGTSPFTYAWSTGATTQNISGLTPGTYTVTVTAAGGCTASKSATVSQPTALSASITAQTNVGCGGTNGQATVAGTGGTTPYSYSWNTVPVQTAATATGLSVNTYTATITDAKGCTASESTAITILFPSGLNATGITTSGATLNWNAVSGAASYNIQYRQSGTSTWTSTTSTTISKSITGLASGTAYEFMVQTVCTSSTSSFSAVAGFTTSVSIGPLLSYTTATSGALNSVDPNATGTALTRVNGATAPGSPCSTGFTSVGFTTATTFTTSLPAIEVTFTPNTGSSFTVTNFSADMRRSASGPASVRFAYSINGGSTWIDQGTNNAPNNAACGTTTTSSWATSVAVNAPTTLKFRVYGFNATGATGTFQILNLTISGSGSGGGGGGGEVCDQTLWNHIYNPTRLLVLDSCASFTGIVANKISEADGDIHIRVTPDAAYAWMINSYNTSGQHGDMIVEPVCVGNITQSNAVAACVGFSNTVYIPNVGEHVLVTGDYTTDNNHGWNEIHPVTSIAIIPAKLRFDEGASINTEELQDLDIRIYPNPVTDYLNFSIESKLSTVIYITVANEIGQIAGQYQMLETQLLTINTEYLPSGKYYYSVVQNSKMVKGGFVLIMH